MTDGAEATQPERDRVKFERLELALRASNKGIWDWDIDEGGFFIHAGFLSSWSAEGTKRLICFCRRMSMFGRRT